jgi:hypothetical protein
MEQQIVLNLGPALMPDFVTGSMFHAILGWPTAEETPKFQHISEELMAGTIRLTKAENPDLARSVMEQWPQFNWVSIEARAQKRKAALGYLNKRLQQRMAAARAGIGKLHEQLFDTPAILPPGMSALSIDQLCALIKSDVTIDDPENVEKLVWRKSLPILPLAIATQLLLAGKYGDRAEMGCDLQDIAFYREAVKLSWLLEELIDAHPQISFTRDQMTLIRWFE